MTALQPLLSVSGLYAVYGATEILRGVDLAVQQTEIVAVLGANGAGKSSLARAIAGVAPGAEGRIEIGGVDATRLPAHRRSRLGVALCHEGRRLFTELTVRENLDLAAAYAGAGRTPRAELLDRVYSLFPLLEQRADSPAGDLSGGQQQMVAIARALMSEPRVVIFDELSLGLAPAVVDEIFATLEQIRAWGIGIVLIEQNVYRSLAVADRVYVIERGQVSFAGPPEELAQRERLEEAYFGTQPRPSTREPVKGEDHA
jgi:ABC-type branched-subunit amino acid transport system ATPase component